MKIRWFEFLFEFIVTKVSNKLTLKFHLNRLKLINTLLSTVLFCKLLTVQCRWIPLRIFTMKLFLVFAPGAVISFVIMTNATAPRYAT